MGQFPGLTQPQVSALVNESRDGKLRVRSEVVRGTYEARDYVGDDFEAEDEQPEEAPASASTAYARSPFRRGQLVLIPANAFGDDYAAEHPETLPETLVSIASVERNETGEERRVWSVQYAEGPFETDESFFDAEPELPSEPPAPVPPPPAPPVDTVLLSKIRKAAEISAAPPPPAPPPAPPEEAPRYRKPTGPRPKDTTGAPCLWDFENGGWINRAPPGMKVVTSVSPEEGLSPPSPPPEFTPPTLPSVACAAPPYVDVTDEFSGLSCAQLREAMTARGIGRKNDDTQVDLRRRLRAHRDAYILAGP